MEKGKFHRGIEDEFGPSLPT